MQGYCVPGCAEDIIGMTFYRYILTNVVSINGVELVTALGKKCLHMASHVEAPWVSYIVIMYCLDLHGHHALYGLQRAHTEVQLCTNICL